MKKEKSHSLLTGPKEKGSKRPSSRLIKDRTGKGYTAEEASVPESDAQDQWLELVDTSVLYDILQTDSPHLGLVFRT